jgi:hypothetical protein
VEHIAEQEINVKAGAYFFDPEDGGDMFLPKPRLTLNGVISQKMVLFITTTARTSNPA